VITIAITAVKGGVAKTTTAVNMSAALVKAGLRVLLVDVDAQASATLWLTDEYGEKGRVVYDVFLRRQRLDDIIRETPSGISLAPSELWLSNLDTELHAEFNRERRLASAIAGLRHPFDYVIIDTPPALTLATYNALVASDVCVIPIDCRPQAFLAVEPVLDVLRRVAVEFENDIRAFALPTFFERTNIARDTLTLIEREFEGATLSAVNKNTKLTEAFVERKTILEYDPIATGAIDYLRVTRELQDAIEEAPGLRRTNSRK
jgi:chromosome partitioning protein